MNEIWHTDTEFVAWIKTGYFLSRKNTVPRGCITLNFTLAKIADTRLPARFEAKQSYLLLKVVEQRSCGLALRVARAVPLVENTVDRLDESFLNGLRVSEHQHSQHHLHDDDHKQEDRVLGKKKGTTLADNVR